MSAVASPSDYFKWLMTFFKIFGLCPPNRRSRRTIYYIIAVPHLIAMISSIVLDLLNVVLNQETFQRKMLSIGVLSMHTAAGLRLLNWFWTRNRYQEVVSMIGQRPGFHSEAVICNNGRREIRRRYGRGSRIEAFAACNRRRTDLICSGIYLLVLTYICLNFLITYTCNYLRETYRAPNPVKNLTSTYRDFPYPMWFPFDVSVSHGYYLPAFLYQAYAYYSLMSGFWCVDWLVLSSIIQLQDRVAVLAFALRQVDKDTKLRVKKQKLVRCVRELDHIFRTANCLEELCNNQLLIQNGLATFILCTLLYVTTTLTVPVEISYMSSAAGIVLLEPFAQCWICQSFTAQFSKVLEEVWSLDWVEYPPQLRQFLVLTMIRLQRPAVFTLGKWRVIDVSFYLQLLKMTYSFYTLISRQNNRVK